MVYTRETTIYTAIGMFNSNKIYNQEKREKEKRRTKKCREERRRAELVTILHQIVISWSIYS